MVFLPDDHFDQTARDMLPLREGEGWGEAWSTSGQGTHLTLSLS